LKGHFKNTVQDIDKSVAARVFQKPNSST